VSSPSIWTTSCGFTKADSRMGTVVAPWPCNQGLRVEVTIEEQGLGQLEETEMFPECARIYREHIPEHEW
jgi:hypothetical protein